MENTSDMLVLRDPSKADWMRSEFFIRGAKFGYGIEDERRNVKVFGETAIDDNTYEMGLRDSPKFSKEYYVDKDGNLSRKKTERYNKPHQLLWVMDVPNFEYVLWHWGNTDDDTHACYIVGSYPTVIKGQEAVGGSRDCYMKIYPIIYNIIMENRKAGKKTFVTYKAK